MVVYSHMYQPEHLNSTVKQSTKHHPVCMISRRRLFHLLSTVFVFLNSFVKVLNPSSQRVSMCVVASNADTEAGGALRRLSFLAPLTRHRSVSFVPAWLEQRRGRLAHPEMRVEWTAEPSMRGFRVHWTVRGMGLQYAILERKRSAK